MTTLHRCSSVETKNKEQRSGRLVHFLYRPDGRARALSGRCACAHSRCGRPCSADAVDRATAWPRESVPTRLDAGLKIDASADVATMQARTHEMVQTFGGV